MHNPVQLKITGSLTSRDSKELKLDWWGGDPLTIATEFLEGDWDSLTTGEWFKATVTRFLDGRVIKAVFGGKIPPPKYMTEEEIEESYSKLNPVKLEPMN